MNARPGWGRMVGASLVAGVVNLVLGIGSAVLWAGAALEGAFAEIGYEMPATAGVALSHTLERLANGAVFVALYVVVRRAVPTARSAAIQAGVLGWFALYVLTMWLMAGYGIFPWRLSVVACLWGVLEAAATVGVGAWVVERGRSG